MQQKSLAGIDLSWCQLGAFPGIRERRPVSQWQKTRYRIYILGVSDLQGKRFLDIGSGSELFSLAVRRLGAVVHSFDHDPKSVGCIQELKRRYFAGDSQWLIEEGSLLDREYLARLGKFDVVYSWGVVGYTGAMWQALENVAPLVAGRGVRAS